MTRSYRHQFRFSRSGEHQSFRILLLDEIYTVACCCLPHIALNVSVPLRLVSQNWQHKWIESIGFNRAKKEKLWVVQSECFALEPWEITSMIELTFSISKTTLLKMRSSSSHIDFSVSDVTISIFLINLHLKKKVFAVFLDLKRTTQILYPLL